MPTRALAGPTRDLGRPHAPGRDLAVVLPYWPMCAQAATRRPDMCWRGTAARNLSAIAVVDGPPSAATNERHSGDPTPFPRGRLTIFDSARGQ